MLNHELPQQTKKILLALIERFREKKRSLANEYEDAAVWALDEFMRDFEGDLNALGLSLEGIEP